MVASTVAVDVLPEALAPNGNVKRGCVALRYDTINPSISPAAHFHLVLVVAGVFLFCDTRTTLLRAVYYS